MTVTACIVQARLGSTRFPAKVLLPLPTGRTVLEEVLFRCHQIPGVDIVVAAIPDTPENDILTRYAVRNYCRGKEDLLVRGPEHDVLARYAKAAEAVKADVIMRITADCPLIDPEVCGQVLRLHRERPEAFVTNNAPYTWPRGFDCEVFSAELLRHTNKTVAQVNCPPREHVTTYMRNGADVPVLNVRSAMNRSHLHWTLDTLQDYITIWGVMEQQTREAA